MSPSKLVRPLLCLLLSSFSCSHAGVTRIEVLSNTPFADGKTFGEVGNYARITGRFYGELDANLPANKAIVDLSSAPRNARGKVEYPVDFDILRPADAAKGIGTLLYDVNNRGNKRAIHTFNDVASSNTLDKATDAGTGS